MTSGFINNFSNCPYRTAPECPDLDRSWFTKLKNKTLSPWFSDDCAYNPTLYRGHTIVGIKVKIDTKI
ncbi:hypothetical protein TRIP_E190234 [uncultured Spirochaetota bacterium]|uniref:Uncharacterized protein n=1 Tax=uncultured Spirochaetota bacterium TaxID=460511 RepID=A0A652ZU82_9SPIR|nr:hypothetical protein TRIP_E190234 [uncultured Spirochaetota bacterium]